MISKFTETIFCEKIEGMLGQQEKKKLSKSVKFINAVIGITITFFIFIFVYLLSRYFVISLFAKILIFLIFFGIISLFLTFRLKVEYKVNLSLLIIFTFLVFYSFEFLYLYRIYILGFKT